MAIAILVLGLTSAHADDRTCGKGIVGFQLDADRPSLAVLVNGQKLYELVPSGLAEVDEHSSPVTSRQAPTLTGRNGSWGPVRCSYWTTWVARVQWTTWIEVAGAPVKATWETVVSVDPSTKSTDDPRAPSNAVEWTLAIDGWPAFASDTDTIAFGMLLRPASNATVASNGGPDFIVLPTVAEYDGVVGDVATAFCSRSDYDAAPWPPCPNRFPAFDVCEKCTVAELNFSTFAHDLRYPAGR